MIIFKDFRRRKRKEGDDHKKEEREIFVHFPANDFTNGRRRGLWETGAEITDFYINPY
jgi:hypothetical protein